MEAPLYPHHSSDPSRPDQQDPVYWVTPRHLAGDDGALAERIGDTLTGLGWRMWPTSRNTLLYVSPDGLYGAEWILAAHPFELGELPVAWQLSARPHAASAMPEWNAYFTAGVPYEVLADLLVAMDAREAPDAGFAGPEAVLDALGAQGWARDVDRPRTTAWDPGFSCAVSLELVPPLVQDADPRPDLVGWQAWADPVVGAPYLWCASFSASIPHDLVAVFASSLASPVPVPRRTLPQSAEGRLSIVHRT
ncbi:SPDY domain-containing protein [Streptomyces sp. O3]